MILSKITGNEIDVSVDLRKQGNELIFSIFDSVGSLSNIKIYGLVFVGIKPTFLARMIGTTFEDCSFIDCDMSSINMRDCEFINCKFKDCQNLETWAQGEGITNDSLKTAPILTPTNEEIAERFHCKVYALPNKSFVKIKWTCDFCHKDFFQVHRRDKVNSPLHDVPNCDKHVCEDCNRIYSLRDKFQGNRTYGYHGDVHKYKTPMDKSNTTIIGLEMEFEGDFYGWKELQDAHQGMLHYGYDSSVIGQNELSWDCGSYSWWKYLAPLKNVCDVLKKFGGRAGDTAGIHIHTSRPDVNMRDTTNKINAFGQTVPGKALFKAISLRNNVERFNMYSNLDCDMSAHHAGISYNSYGTCEFRLFNSTLDYKLILKHIKFCKEVFNAFADRKDVWKGFSPETKKHIQECAKAQLDKGFISDSEYKTIIKKI